MENLPAYVYLVFGVTVLIALFLFYRAANSSARFLTVLLVWITLQSGLGLSGFYQVPPSAFPRLPLLVLPPLLMIINLFSSRRGRQFIDGLDLKTLTLFHTIRIAVELVLFWLFVHKGVSELLTFEGHNLDILSGLSAPLVYYYGFVKKSLSRSVLIGWNLVCLGLVLNVFVTALLAAPTPFQQFAFDQPTIAIQYFPFVLLPSVLVPLVLLAHFAAIRQLLVAGIRPTSLPTFNQEPI